MSVGVRDRDGCRLPWGGLVLGGRAAPFRFGGFHVLVQHPICSVQSFVLLGFVNYIKYVLFVYSLGFIVHFA